ncbi:TNF receptor-associated factor 2-like [Ptychodera flava]|uniref:TNF receptor-associated factor 2-like n=1 Tax=Ptychodera flava TaxID=63121 RepID=UPI00396A0B1E
MPGYSKMVIRGGAQQKYLCVLCLLILKQPRQSLCGHRFCSSCIDDLIREARRYKCPICSTEDPTLEDSILCIETINPDYAIKREMRNLSAKCINEGCEWTGIFIKYVEHEETCDYGLITCFKQGCSEKIKRKDLNIHLERNCRMRVIQCRYCDITLIYKDFGDHMERDCPGAMVMCKFCDEAVPRGKIQMHIDEQTGNCKRTRQACKFHELGCEEMIDRNRQREHSEESIHNHMELLSSKVVDLQVATESHEANTTALDEISSRVGEQGTTLESLHGRVVAVETDVQRMVAQPHQAPNDKEEQTTTQKRNIQRSEERVRSLQSRATVLQTKVATSEGIVAVLNGQVERNAERIGNGKREMRKNQDDVAALERKIRAQDKIMALKDVSLAENDLRIQSLERTSYDGVLSWKITDFARKKSDAISGRTPSQYSPFFFTGRYGYKMCARIYLNGDGMGKGNHVSLFFTIMKGEYDAILRWPFRQKVTFMWIDQDNREHMIDAFRPDVSSSSFKRPTRDMNIASGCPLFMPLSMIENSEHAYVKDDVAFLRIIVDTSDL